MERMGRKSVCCPAFDKPGSFFMGNLMGFGPGLRHLTKDELSGALEICHGFQDWQFDQV
jgi:hypothetical protein